MSDRRSGRNSSELDQVLKDGQLQGVKLKGSTPPLLYREKLIKDLVSNLNSRFAMDKELLQATQLSDLTSWPSAADKEAILEFGEDMVLVWSSHFPSRFDDPDALLQEWRMLKSLLYRRSSKKVNYAAFGAGDVDDDFDEDFKDITPPPAKKAKTTKTSNNTLKKQAIKNNEKEASKKRKPPNDRTFDRELQLALEMSIHESQESAGGGNEPPPLSVGASEPFSITASVEAMEGLNKLTVEATPPVLQPITADQPEVVVLEEEENEKVDTAKPITMVTPKGKLFDDSIEVINSVPEEEPKTRRRTTAKKPVVDSDSESAFDPDEDVENLSDESDDDYEEDNDSDFEGFGKKKKGKGKCQKPTAKKPTTPKSKSSAKSTAKSKTKAAPVSKPVAPRSKATAIRKSMSPSVGQTMSSPVGRSLGGGAPKWTPPGQAGKSTLGGTSMKSPGTSLGGAGTKSPGLSIGAGRMKSPSSSLGGVNIKSPLSGLRLGLSRHQSVKPLHSGLKVKH